MIILQHHPEFRVTTTMLSDPRLAFDLAELVLVDAPVASYLMQSFAVGFLAAGRLLDLDTVRFGQKNLAAVIRIKRFDVGAGLRATRLRLSLQARRYQVMS